MESIGTLNNQVASVMKPNEGKMSTKQGSEAQQSFATWLNDAIKDVNNKQVESTIATERMARGEDIDLHDVMITSQKASVALQTTVEVRNKAMESYKEIMRMQV
ncbi:flagellar hook-basal body complex protein FliE [Alteribacter populi]|uniref:flagellar hook-basal body complex protein FliE n=1 Tax=Alteribacter populi TaxID=2011011 RepID=UPI000BBA5FD7|nr:flagellar hook-basal body complex protein FliE [Alteribacter populi]